MAQGGSAFGAAVAVAAALAVVEPYSSAWAAAAHSYRASDGSR
jgi:hypothetical protein